MIHLRPLPNHPVYIAALAKSRLDIIEDLRREKERKSAANDNKHEAHLIKSNQFRQHGGN